MISKKLGWSQAWCGAQTITLSLGSMRNLILALWPKLNIYQALASAATLDQAASASSPDISPVLPWSSSTCSITRILHQLIAIRRMLRILLEYTHHDLSIFIFLQFLANLLSLANTASTRSINSRACITRSRLTFRSQVGCSTPRGSPTSSLLRPTDSVQFPIF